MHSLTKLVRGQNPLVSARQETTARKSTMSKFEIFKNRMSGRTDKFKRSALLILCQEVSEIYLGSRWPLRGQASSLRRGQSETSDVLYYSSPFIQYTITHNTVPRARDRFGGGPWRRRLLDTLALSMHVHTGHIPQALHPVPSYCT